MDKYERSRGRLPKARDRKLRAELKRADAESRRAADEAAATEVLYLEKAGFLEPETEMEKTYKVTQDQILAGVDEATRAKRFTLKLEPMGPYVCDYSRSGNHLLLGGRRGHVASFDWRRGELSTELQLGEPVHAVKYLQNDAEYFAAAQQKYTYIYDAQTGAEVHELRHHIGATHLEYLPYHYLLASAGTTGWLKYQDVSTGQLVAELRTKLGPTTALTQNPWNAVIHAGHGNGTVTLWAPSMSSPLVKLQTSRGPVRSLAVDRSGNYMVAAGQDRSLKVWDIRNWRVLESYYSPAPASSVDISQRGLVAVGWGPHVQVWKDVLTRTAPKQSAPYLNHLFPGGEVANVRFCPFEDVMGVGCNSGFESLIVPGSGEPNVDALEANPYEYATRTGRREAQVRNLLEKLQPDMITLNPNDIGGIDQRSAAERLNAREQEKRDAELAIEEAEKLQPRPQNRAKNSGIRKLLRKKTRNVLDERKVRLQHALDREKKLRSNKARERNGTNNKTTGAALRRFEK